MSTKLRFSIVFVLVLTLASAGYSEPGSIKLDFDAEDDPDANGPSTEPGYTSFVLSENGKEVNGITIDLSGNLADARRTSPNDIGVPPFPEFQINEEEIHRDFIYGLGDSPVNIDLWGLGAGRKCDIHIWAFDDLSKSQRIANWTANGEELLQTSFIGGDESKWPRDGNPEQYRHYDFNGIGYADELGHIYLTCEADVNNTINPFAFANALEVILYGDYNTVPKAHTPIPFNEMQDTAVDVILQWQQGIYADTHDVYFGADESDVNDANRSNPLGVLVSEDHPTTSYDLPGLLELNKTYYWRIDEVNDPNIWKGKVWSFTTITSSVIEDFDSYENNTALRSVWENGSSSAEVSVETGIAVDSNSMKYEYKNNLPPYYSEVYADTADLGAGNSNWLGFGAQSLVLYFYGDPANRTNEEMYVKLTDGDDPPGTGTAAYGNMKDIMLQQWIKWSIALTEFNDVNLANVEGITIGFGDGTAGSAGTVYFDDVGLSSTYVSPTSLSVAAAANSTGTFTITSNTSWTVSNSEYWLTVSPPSGSGNDTITVTAKENGSLPRTATVTVSPAGDTPQTVAVTQSGIGGGGCTTPPLPAFSSLQDDEKFPDPFTFVDGSCMKIDEWECRRAELAELIQEFELGYKQETPYSATTGSFGYIQIEDDNYPVITVDVNDNGETISFSCVISYPATGSAPYPAMIGIGSYFFSLDIPTLSNLGVAIIYFPNDEIAEQIDAGSRGNGKFYDMYGSGHSAGALMAWAWGVDRLIDAIEKTPAANIDPNRLGVTGCSRNGKGALIAGAFDERIKLTIPQESGAGGAASWRVSQYQRDVLGQNVQWLAETCGENVWLRENFSQFGDAVDKVPFDHHMIAALCAPRALLIIENSSMEWLGNLSTWTTGNAAHLVWEGLGIPDRMGYSQVGNHGHCSFPSSQLPELTAYVGKFLVGGGTGDTNIMYTDGLGVTFDPASWVDWVDWAVPNPFKGDLNQDCSVGYSDLGLFVERWLDEDCVYGSLCYEADLNYDGGVDFLDYAELAVNWLEED